MNLEWEAKKGRNGTRWEAMTLLGKIRVSSVLGPTHSYSWLVVLPDGTSFRAGSDTQGKAYAADWLARQRTKIPD